MTSAPEALPKLLGTGLAERRAYILQTYTGAEDIYEMLAYGSFKSGNELEYGQEFDSILMTMQRMKNMSTSLLCDISALCKCAEVPWAVLGYHEKQPLLQFCL